MRTSGDRHRSTQAGAPAQHYRHRVGLGSLLGAILTDGRRIVREVDDVPGFVGRPMNRADVERKFRSNVGKRWPVERTDAILQALWALDETKDLSLLLGMLSVRTKK